jgi:alpha-tubulin suppressor-like RCC1 family protein
VLLLLYCCNNLLVISLGAGRKAVSISLGYDHACAVLDDRASVLCWGSGGSGRLGYGSTRNVGDTQVSANTLLQ